VDPVPDPLLLRKFGSAGNRSGDLWICSQEFWLLDHRADLEYIIVLTKSIYRWMHLLRQLKTCRIFVTSRKLVVTFPNENVFSVIVEYTMHTCSKIIVENEGAMTSGCVTSVTNNSRRTEVCACKSYPGMQPCNSGRHSYTPVTVVLLLVVFLLTLKFVT
jgi:hypothetical protein